MSHFWGATRKDLHTAASSASLPSGCCETQILRLCLPLIHQRTSAFSEKRQWFLESPSLWLLPGTALLTAAVCHTFTGLFCDGMCHFHYKTGCIWKVTAAQSLFPLPWPSLPPLTSSSINFQSVCHLSLSVCFVSFISPWAINTELLQSFWSWLLAESQVSSCPVQLNDTHLPHTWLSSPSLQRPQLPSQPYMGDFISGERGRSRWPKEAMGS